MSRLDLYTDVWIFLVMRCPLGYYNKNNIPYLTCPIEDKKIITETEYNNKIYKIYNGENGFIACKDILEKCPYLNSHKQLIKEKLEEHSNELFSEIDEEKKFIKTILGLEPSENGKRFAEYYLEYHGSNEGFNEDEPFKPLY